MHWLSGLERDWNIFEQPKTGSKEKKEITISKQINQFL